jgi:hypothetical protein
MDRLEKYIESLIAERARVDSEIARLERIVRMSRSSGSAPPRKTVGREGLPPFSESSPGAPSSRPSSDRF